MGGGSRGANAPERASREEAGARAPLLHFADTARRLGAATQAAGLVVPAFRCPPRVPGARRTVRHYPGGAIVSVRMAGRPFEEVAVDMVEGVLVVNHLDGEAKVRLRTALLETIATPPPDPGLASPRALVAEGQTQAA